MGDMPSSMARSGSGKHIIVYANCAIACAERMVLLTQTKAKHEEIRQSQTAAANDISAATPVAKSTRRATKLAARTAAVNSSSVDGFDASSATNDCAEWLSGNMMVAHSPPYTPTTPLHATPPHSASHTPDRHPLHSPASASTPSAHAMRLRIAGQPITPTKTQPSQPPAVAPAVAIAKCAYCQEGTMGSQSLACNVCSRTVHFVCFDANEERCFQCVIDNPKIHAPPRGLHPSQWQQTPTQQPTALQKQVPLWPQSMQQRNNNAIGVASLPTIGSGSASGSVDPATIATVVAITDAVRSAESKKRTYQQVNDYGQVDAPTATGNVTRPFGVNSSLPATAYHFTHAYHHHEAKPQQQTQPTQMQAHHSPFSPFALPPTTPAAQFPHGWWPPLFGGDNPQSR
jgi:hypothetical protein